MPETRLKLLLRFANTPLRKLRSMENPYEYGGVCATKDLQVNLKFVRVTVPWTASAKRIISL